MSRTYDAILHGDRVEWTGERPSLGQEHPVRVQISLDTAPETPAQAAERARKLREILDRLAELNPFAEIKDSVEWQREIRRDRPLPGREP